eukprot:COSAG01_NODE_5783_length_4035_cov_4.057673_3_plen_105_part_01
MEEQRNIIFFAKCYFWTATAVHVTFPEMWLECAPVDEKGRSGLQQLFCSIHSALCSVLSALLDAPVDERGRTERSVTLFINSVTDRSCINRIACNSHSDNKKPIP